MPAMPTPTSTAAASAAMSEQTAVGEEPILRPPVLRRSAPATAPPPLSDIPTTYPQREKRIHGTDTPITGSPAVRNDSLPIPQSGPWQPPTGPVAIPKQLSILRVAFALVILIGIGVAIAFAAC
jgi:hypothetical protein